MTLGLAFKITLFSLMVAAWVLVIREDRQRAAKRNAELDEMINRYTSLGGRTITMRRGVDYE